VYEHGSCSVWGEGHYTTFDGKKFQYHGHCTYALAIDCRAGKDDFAVHIENGVGCNGNSTSISCKRAVVTYINDIPIKINHNSVVFKDDEVLSLPHDDNDFIVSKHGDYIFLDVWNGKLIVKYDGKNSVYIHLSEEYKNGTCGLCGNFNGVKSDDLQLPNDKGIAKSVLDYGNAWAKPKFGQTCLDAQAPIDSCKKVSDLVMLMSQMKCKALKLLKAFSACRKLVDPEPYYQSCLQEMCKCGGKPDCICNTFEQYGRACLQHGIKINWRTPDLCRKCSLNNIKLVYYNHSTDLSSNLLLLI